MENAYLADPSFQMKFLYMLDCHFQAFGMILLKKARGRDPMGVARSYLRHFFSDQMKTELGSLQYGGGVPPLSLPRDLQKLHQQRNLHPMLGGQEDWRVSQRPLRKEPKQRPSSTPPTSCGTRNYRIPKPHGVCPLERPTKTFSPTRTFEPPFLRCSITSLITRQKYVWQ